LAASGKPGCPQRRLIDATYLEGWADQRMTRDAARNDESAANRQLEHDVERVAPHGHAEHRSLPLRASVHSAIGLRISADGAVGHVRDDWSMSAPTEMLEEVVGSSDEVLREQALRSLKKRRDFKTHLFIYAVVNATIWAVWLILGVTSNNWWPWAIFPTLGWGIGLAANAWDVYMRQPVTEDDIDAEIRRIKGS
jgi:hypothetical protein